MSAEQLIHQIKQAAAQQDIDQRYFVFGHVSTYDPATHRIRAILPSWRDELGRPIQTGWIQLGTVAVGNGFGLQSAPYGGATMQNPTAGEQVQIELVDRVRGVGIVAAMLYNNVMQPPSTAIGGLAPGETVLRHQTGTYVWLRASGDVDVNVLANANVTVGGNATITVSGTAAIYAAAIRLGKAALDSLQALCTNAFYTWVIGHVHNDPQGGVTGTPTTTPPANALTSIVEAE